MTTNALKGNAVKGIGKVIEGAKQHKLFVRPDHATEYGDRRVENHGD